jgi:hypothetical protein
MKIEESLTELSAKLDAWLDRSLPAFSSQDSATHDKRILRGIAIIKEFDRLKAQGMATVRSALNQRKPLTDGDRKASLIRAFEFGARLIDVLYDQFLDTDGGGKVWQLLDQIVLNLSKLDPGRAELEVLFDNPHAGVRAAAGAYLIDLVPQRVVPMLDGIVEAERGTSAGFRATWTLLAWERERKSRFNYLNEQE